MKKKRLYDSSNHEPLVAQPENRLQFLFEYLKMLTQLNAQAVNVMGEINAVTDEINDIMELDVKMGTKRNT